MLLRRAGLSWASLGGAVQSGWEFASHNAPLAFLILFAVLGMSFMVMLYWGLTWIDRHLGRSEQPALVAKISLMKDCSFATGERPLAETMQLEKGRQLHLEKGLLQITYDTGAVVLIAGPATYKIESNNSGSLGLGKLTAQVGTIEAEGFTINTPNARFVDLGTEFGVKVDDKNREEAHVFIGRVNAETKSAGGGWNVPVPLRQGQAFVWKGEQYTVQAARRTDFPPFTPQMQVSNEPQVDTSEAAEKQLDLLDVVAGGDGFNPDWKEIGMDRNTGNKEKDGNTGDVLYRRANSQPFIAAIIIPGARKLVSKILVSPQAYVHSTSLKPRIRLPV